MLHRQLVILAIATLPLLTSCARPQQTSVALVRVRHDGGTVREYEVFRETQMALLTSPFIVNSALRDIAPVKLETLESLDNPLAWLQSNLKVECPGDSEIIRVALTSTNGVEANLIVQAVVDSLINETGDIDRQDQAGRLGRLKEKYELYLAESKEQMEKINQLADAMGLPDSKIAKVQIETEELQTIQNLIAEVRSDLLKVQAENELDSQRGEQAGDSADRAAVLAKQLAALQQERQAKMELLWQAFGLSADLFLEPVEAEKLTAQALNEKLTELADEIIRVQSGLRNAARVQLVQPAVIVAR